MDPRRTDPNNFALGKHVTYFEEPDIIFMKFKGAVSDDEGLELLRRQLQFANGHDLLFFLIDAEELISISPAARKAVAEKLKEVPLRGMAIYAAPLKARVITKLIITAVNLFRKDDHNPVHFLDNEREARDWIASRRQKYSTQ